MEKIIKEIEYLEGALKRAKEKLKDAEVTYSIGDKFEYQSKEYMLVMSDSKKVLMVGLGDGYWWCQSQDVHDIHCITQLELDQMGGKDFVLISKGG